MGKNNTKSKLPDVSILVPAYNEEGNIESAVRGLIQAIKGYVRDYQVVVIDDGSNDRTTAIIKKLACENPKITLVRHEKNMGFGLSFIDGLRYVNKSYVTQFHGDNDASPRTVVRLIKETSNADLIFNYPGRSVSRGLLRKIYSQTFIVLMNLLFGLTVRYYNGSFICKTSLVRNLHLVSRGFAIYAESKVRLIKRGARFTEIPFEHTGRKSGQTKAVSLKSVVETLQTISRLFIDVYFLHAP